jgi:hypothetical protein
MNSGPLSLRTCSGAPRTANRHPRLTDTAVNGTAQDLAAQWGIAEPMAVFFDTNGSKPARWARDTSFQIICAGLDGLYFTAVTSLTTGQRVPIFPTGYVFDANSNYMTQGYYTNGDLDNLTNLANKNLENARNQAQQ